MADTMVKNATCRACDADVREGSLFCYNCGSAIESKPDLLVENGDKKVQDPVKSEAERPPLRSAASLRKQRRAHNRQPVQITWEQPEGPPIAFFIVSIALTVVAAILLVLAFYLR